MLGEGPIPGVTWLPRYGGPGEGWRVDMPLRNLHGLSGLSDMGFALGDESESIAEAKTRDMVKAGGFVTVVAAGVFFAWLLTRKKK